ncbi:MAG: SUMF1/EgtB/PvdO family nonheme iron enzyme [Armatimonadota bacterium]|jgi:pectate lyase
MTTRRLTLLAAAAAMVAMMAAPQVAALPAFPGAEGFGADTPGGRGGRIIEVTTLEPRGPGSLDEALRAEGPRIVVFRVAGTIDMQGGLSITQPFITVAGQTAPGDGICLTNGTLRISTNNVILRHLRVRPGDHPTGGDPENRDCIVVAGDADRVHDVIIDHCSFSWGIDENVSTWYAPKRVTIQWSITSESLFDSLHPKGRHGMGMILGSEENTVSVHHCLFAHNGDRHPLAGDMGREDLQPSVFDFRNNVLYNYRGPAGSYRSGLRVNHVGNVLLPGPDSGSSVRGINYQADADQLFYLSDNLWPGRTADDPETRIMGTIAPEHTPPPGHVIAAEPIDTPPVTTHPASEVLDAVLAHVGATLPVRDVIDDRIVREVRDGSGRIIDSQWEVGGFAEYAAAEPPVDTDGDGMPDAWEIEHGLDPNDPADGPQDLDGDGYTNVEEYLNGTDPTRPDTGEPIAKPQVTVQSGNDHLRFGVARRDWPTTQYDPADRAEFVQRVRASGASPAQFLEMPMLRVEPGEYVRDQITVRITRPFEIGVTPVTQAQWERVMGTRPWEGQTWARNDPDAPVTYVNWHDAVEFCERLTAAGDALYALPTEAQWELACRAGRAEDAGPWWFEQSEATRFAWLLPNTAGASEPWPHPVATLEPNPLGLHDMPGNVLEWTADLHDYWTWRIARAEPLKIDPTGGTTRHGLRVVCGGSIYYSPRQLMTYPMRERLDVRATFDIGFRVIRTEP